MSVHPFRLARPFALVVAALAVAAPAAVASPATVPTVSVADAAVVEGQSGQVAIKFRVRLSAASAETVLVRFETSDGSATAGSDYVARTGRVRFDPGMTRRVIRVTVNGDTAPEPDEGFVVTLTTARGATVADGTASGTIVSDDDPLGTDGDGDGWTANEGDCDDGDAAINPGADEVADGVDNDCDDLVDHADSDFVPPDCDDGDPYTIDSWDSTTGSCVHVTDTEADHDGDGFVAEEVGGPDCDDGDENVHPDATEVVGDFIDNNCDGRVDE